MVDSEPQQQEQSGQWLKGGPAVSFPRPALPSKAILSSIQSKRCCLKYFPSQSVSSHQTSPKHFIFLDLSSPNAQGNIILAALFSLSENVIRFESPTQRSWQVPIYYRVSFQFLFFRINPWWGEHKVPPLPHLFLYFFHVLISNSPSGNSTWWEITVIPDLKIFGQRPASQQSTDHSGLRAGQRRATSKSSYRKAGGCKQNEIIERNAVQTPKPVSGLLKMHH